MRYLKKKITLSKDLAAQLQSSVAGYLNKRRVSYQAAIRTLLELAAQNYECWMLSQRLANDIKVFMLSLNCLSDGTEGQDVGLPVRLKS